MKKSQDIQAIQTRKKLEPMLEDMVAIIKRWASHGARNAPPYTVFFTVFLVFHGLSLFFNCFSSFFHGFSKNWLSNNYTLCFMRMRWSFVTATLTVEPLEASISIAMMARVSSQAHISWAKTPISNLAG